MRKSVAVLTILIWIWMDVVIWPALDQSHALRLIFALSFPLFALQLVNLIRR